jgi:hypothetical protein
MLVQDWFADLCAVRDLVHGSLVVSRCSEDLEGCTQKLSSTFISWQPAAITGFGIHLGNGTTIFGSRASKLPPLCESFAIKLA